MPKAHKPFAISHEPFRILVTGGHHTPALAVLDEIERLASRPVQVFWVGHKYSLTAEKKELSVEYKTITGRGIPFYPISAGKFSFLPLLARRGYTWGWEPWFYSVRSLLLIPWGIVQSFWILMRVRPHLVLSFGGYLAAPLVLAGFILGIPTYTHEQTVILGWANRLISFFAKKIFVSWEESKKFFPSSKVVVTGNPLRKEIFEASEVRFFFRNTLPTIYISGGKQGAHVINEAVRGFLSEFLKTANLIHQTGSSSEYQDYAKLTLLREQLPEHLKKRYIIQEYFWEKEIGSVFAASSFVVSRAGANTVYELAALGKPAILIPIPWSSHQEQRKNAEILEKLGAAVLLPQDKLTSRALLSEVEKMIPSLPRYKRAAQKAQSLIKLDASEVIAREILEEFK